MGDERRFQTHDGRILTFDEYYAEMNERKRKRSSELATLPMDEKMNMLGAMWKVLREYETSLVKTDQTEQNSE